ncbi:MAG: pantoate--beta-alanine ligase [Candidatus Lindowbacteria bacterium RIFCSPLOWO2_12_FULL_62_27]|nr:MAG: pantoate--beta-alanine ligase [Candidatus Lindowbacteria bacterium RIFCSPLOWO2_12_FULL_62_27]
MAGARRRRRRVGLVPTMGALHAGHETLIRESLHRCDRTVVSIYVNPLQFDSAADFGRYPRPLRRDLAVLRRLGVDVAYCPKPSVFPAGCALRVTEPRVSEILEGRVRPGHFEGVLTIVAKLFLQVRPTHVFFGEKDFQQLWLIRRLLREFRFGIELVAVPTVREPSGLACSSRNELLSARGRRRAAEIYHALSSAARRAGSGGRPVSIVAQVRRRLMEKKIRPEYIVLVDPVDFTPARRLIRPGARPRLLAGCRIDGIHLIDNISIP